MVPVVDIVEIGTGGGSIAWIDDGGALKVGPKSAGADPGPACYGRGGDRPTVTDAKLLAGVLNPEYVLGGRLRVHPTLAREAMARLSAAALMIWGLAPMMVTILIIQKDWAPQK